MDAAKAIALMLYHKEKGAEFLYQNGDDEAAPCRRSTDDLRDRF